MELEALCPPVSIDLLFMCRWQNVLSDMLYLPQDWGLVATGVPLLPPHSRDIDY